MGDPMVEHLIDEETKVKLVVERDGSEPGAEPSADSDPSSAEESPVQEDPAAAASEPAESAAPKNCSFKMGELYAEGSASRLFHASHQLLKGDFSLKLISQDLYRNETAAQRLLRSLQMVSQVSNPHLASYYESGRMKDGSIYVVSEQLKGRTLKDMIAAGELLNSQRFIEIFRQVSQALKSLHQQNVVHGDLKPSNIFLVESASGHDFVKLLDYGIASAFTEEERLEYLKLLSLSGCPNYMSPEQCLSFGLDARTDIYSMGLVMHEALTGSPLVDGHSQVHALLKQLNLNPKSLHDLDNRVPESIEKIIMKCLQKNRSTRYFAIDDLELELELAASDVSNIPGLAEPTPMLSVPVDIKVGAETNKRKKKRRRLIIAGVVGALAVTSISAANDMRLTSNAARHEAEMENATAIRTIAMASQNNDLTQQGPPWRREGFRSHHALRHFKSAERSGLTAIWLYKMENLFHRDNKYRHHLSGLQTFMGELYLKDQYNDDGSRRDRNEWLSRSNEADPVDLARMKLYPAFPGLLPAPKAFPDYASANYWFDKASRTVKRNYDQRDLNLLWDRAYTKFQLDSKNPEVIELHRKIIEITQSQPVVDKNTLIMSYRNIGLIYLMNGEFGKAVHEIKEARKIDADFNKIPGPFSAQLRVELAYAFLKEGKFDVAEMLAKENLDFFSRGALNQTMSALPELLNSQVLQQALVSQGKIDEARSDAFATIGPFIPDRFLPPPPNIVEETPPDVLGPGFQPEN